MPRLLLLTLDQKQTQCNIAHVMAALYMCAFRGDLFHRSWNDFKWALKWSSGWMFHSMMQLCRAFNVNYGGLSTWREYRREAGHPHGMEDTQSDAM